MIHAIKGESTGMSSSLVFSSLDGDEGTGIVKEDDADSGVASGQCRMCLLQQTDDGIIYTDMGLGGKLQQVL